MLSVFRRKTTRQTTIQSSQHRQRPGGDGGPQKLNRKPSDGKFTKKRKHPGSRKDEGSEGKKPKWDEFKQKKKELKQNRQQNEKKESYLIVSRAKQVWEIVRRKGCDKRKRTKQMKELQRLVKEKLKQCKQQVGAVMSAFKGIVRQMLRHSEKLESIMDEMKQILTPVAQKEAVIKHSLIHKVFLDFFEHAPAKQRTEMIESIREAVVYMAHTHNGARVIMHCLWHGNPKDRKVIVKTMKSYIGKFAMDDAQLYYAISPFRVMVSPPFIWQSTGLVIWC
ncbi:hypothetical protein cypCar_00030906 [Cyprinus carpio]|nr:hypothetical protein cypCar_00030906 [Cyprinus carpio]